MPFCVSLPVAAGKGLDPFAAFLADWFFGGGESGSTRVGGP